METTNRVTELDKVTGDSEVEVKGIRIRAIKLPSDAATASNDVMPLTVGAVLVSTATVRGRVIKRYRLSVLRVGPLAMVAKGDIVWLLVRIPTLTGLPYYHGVLEGRVTAVMRRRIQLLLPSEYSTIAEQVYLRHWPVYIEAVLGIQSPNNSTEQENEKGGGA